MLIYLRNDTENHEKHFKIGLFKNDNERRFKIELI